MFVSKVKKQLFFGYCELFYKQWCIIYNKLSVKNTQKNKCSTFIFSS